MTGSKLNCSFLMKSGIIYVFSQNLETLFHNLIDIIFGPISNIKGND